MRVSQVMTQHVECVQPNATLQEAAERMKAMDIGALPVCDEDRLEGMLTDRDIAVRSVSAGRDACIDRVGDVMTPEVFCCYADDEVSAAAELMKEKQVRRLLVLNREKRLVGIISLGDLAIGTDNDALVGETLEGVSEPYTLRHW
jgi:CBS domain-containing protein